MLDIDSHLPFCYFFFYKQKFIQKVTEVETVSQLGCVGSGNKLQRQKKGRWSLEKERAKVRSWREEEGERCGCAGDRDRET